MYVNGTQFNLLQLFALHNSWINPFGIATTELLIVGDIRSNDVYLACSFGGKKAQSQADSSFWPMARVPVTISHGRQHHDGNIYVKEKSYGKTGKHRVGKSQASH